MDQINSDIAITNYSPEDIWTGQDIFTLLELDESFDQDPPTFIVKQSDKPDKKKKPYLYSVTATGNHLITTNPFTQIYCELKNGTIGDQIQLSCRFEDGECVDVPVCCDKCPHTFPRCKHDHENAKGSCFCVINDQPDVDLVYATLDGHPTATLHLKEYGSVNFSVAFKCLVSCAELTSTTRSHLVMGMKLLDRNGKEKATEKYSVRVCKAVKRDHETRLNPPKRSVSDRAVVSLNKRMKIEADEEQLIVLEINAGESSDIMNQNCTSIDPLLPDMKYTKAPVKCEWEQQHRMMQPSTHVAPDPIFNQPPIIAADTAAAAVAHYAPAPALPVPVAPALALPVPAAPPAPTVPAFRLFRMKSIEDDHMVTDFIKRLDGEVMEFQFQCQDAPNNYSAYTIQAGN